MKLAKKILEKAEEKAHLAEMKSSADLCIEDCKFWIKDGNEKLAIYRGLKSLAYSIGVYHETYKRYAQKASDSGYFDYIPFQTKIGA